MAPRANWKGRMVVGEVGCGVGLYTAASTSDRIAFHTINRATGNRVQRRFVDSETGKPVPREDEVKGYEVDEGDHILLEDEDLAAAVPESDKTLRLDRFIDCDDVDTLFFDRPYYLAPSDPASVEVFALIREGMAARSVAALARTVLFRRVRTLLIRPQGLGLVASTLQFDHEVKVPAEIFADIPDIRIEGEMLDLAAHIIGTKRGSFDPAEFDDRYEAALADLVKAKLEGRKIQKPKARREDRVVDLMTALRESAGAVSKPRKAGAKKPAPRRKAG
ncbi:Ku protein [Tabrizicola aquatica]|uniref:non-homologous end joining protein Ku n=1 Tax=Tabrizicola aquatica TaxID=909926 RepID=UPI000CD06CAE|nr:Ku protein [Tabrizicola aquatica]